MLVFVYDGIPWHAGNCALDLRLNCFEDDADELVENALSVGFQAGKEI